MAVAYDFKIYIDGTPTSISAEQYTKTLKLDETLDSAVLVVEFSTRATAYQRFARVDVTVNSTYVDNWLVWADKVEVSTKGTSTTYKHTMQLIEPTKRLEKYIVGSMAFTQTLSEVRYTLKDVVDKIIALTPFVPYSKIDSTRVIVLETALADRLALITAPQLYIEKKNMREALIEVFRYINAIPRVYFDSDTPTLTADFINERHTLLDLTFSTANLVDYGDEASAEYYAERVESFVENVIPTEDDTEPSVITEMVSFRNNDVIIGESDFRLILKSKIQRLHNLFVIATSGITVTKVSLNDYIFEKKVYDTLDLDDGQGSKAYSVYWTYGSNEIAGFSETFGAFGTQIAIDNILDLLNLSSSETAVFMVEYTPLVETARIEQYRQDTTDFEDGAIIINQNERINSSFRLTNNLFGQIQRLGVNTLVATKIHASPSEYWQVGDYTADGFLITTCEFAHFNSYIVGRYEFSKNWNRIGQFVEIDKQFRPYEISLAKSDMTVKRDILMPFLAVEISKTANVLYEESELVNIFFNTFRTAVYETDLPPRIADIQVCKKVGDEIVNETSGEKTIGVYMPIVSTSEKNTIKYKVDFLDTKSAGKNVVLESAFLTNVRKQNLTAYTKSDGSIDYLKVRLKHSFWEFPFENYTHPTAGYISTQATLRVIANYEPLADDNCNIVLALGVNSVSENSMMTFVDPNNIYPTYADFPATGDEDTNYLDLSTYELYYYTTGTSWQLYGYVIAIKKDVLYELPIYKVIKDPADVLGLEMSIPLKISNQDINQFIIGDMLVKDNALLKMRTVAKTLRYYNMGRRVLPSDSARIDTNGKDYIEFNNSHIVSNRYIYVPNDVRSYPYFVIADEDGNVYLGVNQIGLDGNTSTVSSIYFNFIPA